MDNDIARKVAAILEALETLPEPAPKKRINRGRIIVDTLAEHDLHLSIGEANKLLRRHVERIADSTGMTSKHVLRHYVDDCFVRRYADTLARTLLEAEQQFRAQHRGDPACPASPPPGVYRDK